MVPRRAHDCERGYTIDGTVRSEHGGSRRMAGRLVTRCGHSRVGIDHATSGSCYGLETRKEVGRMDAHELRGRGRRRFDKRQFEISSRIS
jgi:hypothetical protein